MPAPTYTQLEAINAILRCCAVTGLTSYPSTSPDENELAAGAAFDQAVKQIANKDDFPWSTRGDKRRYTPLLSIAADASGRILLEPSAVPYHVARVQLHPTDTDYPNKHVDVRALSGVRYLYNLDEDTFIWGVGASKTVQVSYALDFDSLPAPAQEWVIASAQEIFTQSKLSDPIGLQKAEKAKGDAWAALLGWSLQVEVPRLNMMDGEDIADTSHIYDAPFGTLIY